MTSNSSIEFSEDSSGLSLHEAVNEAKRCLNCKQPKCKEGCPIANNIPEFIRAVSLGNFGEARNYIAEKSNLPAVCGRVCAHELQCEGSCVLNQKGKPVKIGLLERFVADFAFDANISHEKIVSKTRGKIGVIGSGPAGLTVAGDLAKIGFSVTVFEALPEPGGVLLYGIPEFRLPKEIVRREIKQIETHGVNFSVNRTIGADLNVDTLFGMGYDALFIGTGTAVSKELDIPGKELIGIVQANYLLRMIALYGANQIERKELPIHTGEHSLVIGGGNVAIDAARSLLRMGAGSVSVVYRGTRGNMSALKSEYDSAVSDGVKFLWEHVPKEFVGEGQISGLSVTTPSGELTVPAEKIYLAIGSRPANRIVSTTGGIDVDDNGYVITKLRPYGMTTRKGVFAGGDVVHRPATVVMAMKEAKKVAAGIAEYVDAVKLLEL